MKELTGFPAGQHDDQVDSTSLFLDYIATKIVGHFRFAPNGKKMQIRKPGRRGNTQPGMQKYGNMVAENEEG